MSGLRLRVLECSKKKHKYDALRVNMVNVHDFSEYPTELVLKNSAFSPIFLVLGVNRSHEIMRVRAVNG